MDSDFIKEMALSQKADRQEYAQFALEMGLATFGVDVLINGVANRIVTQSRYLRDGNEKTAFSQLNAIDIGDVILLNNKNWIVTSYPIEGEGYSKAYIKRCNADFPIKTSTVKVQTGKDWRNFPIYTEQAQYTNIPCIVDTRIYEKDSDEQPINLPHGQLRITMPYNSNSKLIKIDMNFDMYGDKYKVVSIDRNHIISERGILVLSCSLEN